MSGIENVIESVTKAQEKGTFSVLDAAAGVAYPTDSVTIFTDVASGYRASMLQNEAAKIDDVDRLNEIDEEIATLVQKIKDTALTFNLRGFNQKVLRGILDSVKTEFEDIDYGPGAERANMKYIATSIESVENAQGEVDNHVWTWEDVANLKGSIPEESFNQLAVKTAQLSLASTYFDEATDADFLSESLRGRKTATS